MITALVSLTGLWASHVLILAKNTRPADAMPSADPTTDQILSSGPRELGAVGSLTF